MSVDFAKQAAGKKASQFLENGMIVGLGTGSTAVHFIESLIERVKNGLKVRAVASSRHSADLAKKGGVEIIDINAAPHIDVTIDGADEVDQQKRLIKGAGGAHLREKILASSSKELMIIIDESKQVSSLGKAKLPVEVLFYGSPSTRRKLEALGYQGQWRMNEDNTLFVTENGNLLFDIQFPHLLTHPEHEEEKILSVPGVIDTGFFFKMAGRLIVGCLDGSVKIL